MNWSNFAKRCQTDASVSTGRQYDRRTATRTVVRLRSSNYRPLPLCGRPGEPVDGAPPVGGEEIVEEPVDEAPPLDGCVPYTAPVVVPDVDVPDVDAPLGFVEEPLFDEPLATPFKRF